MLYALWGDKVINAEEIAETEASETPVRLASGNKVLRCVDPDCEFPLVFYKHGQKKRAHFCHAKEGRCDYGDFDRTDTSELREARNALYQHFKSLGYDVEREKKLPDSKRYAHLLLHIGDNNIVVQIAQESTSAKYIQSMTQECEKCGFELRWIVLGYYSEVQPEKENYHAMRYQYNHSANRDLLVLDMDAGKISQHKIDENNYSYKSYNLGGRFSEYFRFTKAISCLRIADCELTLDGFSEAYNSWLDEKHTAFEKMKQQVDEQERKRASEAAEKAARANQPVLRTLPISKPAAPKPPKPQITITPEMISQYQVGTKIRHRIRGDGEILSITTVPETHEHIIVIRYKERERSCNLEDLLKSKAITIL